MANPGYPVPMTFQGQPATLEVVRDNGDCWCRIRTAAGESFEYTPSRDYYDLPDAEAAALMASEYPTRLAPRERN